MRRASANAIVMRATVRARLSPFDFRAPFFYTARTGIDSTTTDPPPPFSGPFFPFFFFLLVGERTHSHRFHRLGFSPSSGLQLSPTINCKALRVTLSSFEGGTISSRPVPVSLVQDLKNVGRLILKLMEIIGMIDILSIW